MSDYKYKIGFVLSGGGARGFAHLGVMQALNEAGIFPDVISGVVRLLRDNLRARTFEELKIPLFVSATDLNHGKAVYFSEGELLNPVIASASIPVLFKPVIMNNIYYVDGGVLDNLPISV